MVFELSNPTSIQKPSMVNHGWYTEYEKAYPLSQFQIIMI